MSGTLNGHWSEVFGDVASFEGTWCEAARERRNTRRGLPMFLIQCLQ